MTREHQVDGREAFPKTVAEGRVGVFLDSVGASWRVVEGSPKRETMVEVDLPDFEITQQILVCDVCEEPMELRIEVDEDFFRRFGLLVRFNNNPLFVCKSCGLEIPPDTSPNLGIIGRTKHLLIRQLYAHDLEMEPAPIDKIREALI